MTWNFDMSAAPRDPKIRILVADPGSKPGAESVFESHWIPVKLTTTGKVLEGDRWSGFTRGREPRAWMPLPEYPHSQSDVGEVAAVMGHAHWRTPLVLNRRRLACFSSMMWGPEHERAS